VKLKLFDEELLFLVLTEYAYGNLVIDLGNVGLVQLCRDRFWLGCSLIVLLFQA